MVPPVELMVKPVAALFAITDSLDDDKVNAGAAFGVAEVAEDCGPVPTPFMARIITL